MSKVPNSYEDAQEILKSKPSRRRSPILRTIIITTLSLSVVFLVWILYPLPAPKFAIRSMLPSHTAISIESHNPVTLWKALKKDNYLKRVQSKPIWTVLEREYQKNHKTTLSFDTSVMVKMLDEKTSSIIGLRNILAIAGGVSYTENGKENLHAILWLDNVGFLALKVALYTKPLEVYKNIRYFKVSVNSTQSLYIAPSPAYPRALLITTDLKSLTEFRIPPKKYLTTKFDKEEDIIEANIFPQYLPSDIGLNTPPITGGEINIVWSTSLATATGTVEFSKSIIPNSNTTKPTVSKFIIKNPAPSLTINLQLPNKTVSTETNNFIASIVETSDPLIKPLLSNLDQNFTKELDDQVSLMLTEPTNKDSTSILDYARLYFGVKNNKSSQEILNADLKKLFLSYSSSSDPTLKLLSSQFNIESKDQVTSITVPMLPKVNAVFSKVGEESYIELKKSTLDDFKPEATNIKDSLFNLSLSWNHSPTLAGSIANSIPRTLQTEAFAHFDTTNTVNLNDILKFLSSSKFFTLSFSANIDNSSIIDINVTHSFTE